MMDRNDVGYNNASSNKFSLDQTINYLLYLVWFEVVSFYRVFKPYLPIGTLIILLSVGITSDGTLSFSSDPDSNSLLYASLSAILSKTQSAKKYIESLTWSELLVINLFLIIFFAVFAVAVFCLVTCIWGEEAVVRWIHTRNARKRALEESEGGPPESGIVGLVNLGNTCYMNTVLTCLSAIPEFSDYFAEGKYRLPSIRSRRQRFVMSDLLRDVFLGIRSDKHRAFAPEAFHFGISTLLPHFAGSDQQDNQEFLLALLSFLHEELGAGQATYPPISDSPQSVPGVTPVSGKAVRRLRSASASADGGAFRSLDSAVSNGEGESEALLEKGGKQRIDKAAERAAAGLLEDGGVFSSSNMGSAEEGPVEATSATSTTIVTAIFQGEQVTQTRCPTCDNVVVCHESFLSLPLSLPPCTRYYSVQLVSIAAQVPIDGKDIIRATNSVLLRNYEKMYRQTILQNLPPPKKPSLFPVPKYAPVIERLVSQLPLLSFHSISVSHPSSMFTFKDALARKILQYCAKRLHETVKLSMENKGKASPPVGEAGSASRTVSTAPKTANTPDVPMRTGDAIKNALELESTDTVKKSPGDAFDDFAASLGLLEKTLGELSGSIAQHLPFDMVIGSMKNGVLQNRYSSADSTSVLPPNLVVYCVPHIPPRVLNWQAMLVVQRVREWRINQDQVPYDETLGILPEDAQTWKGADAGAGEASAPAVSALASGTGKAEKVENKGGEAPGRAGVPSKESLLSDLGEFGFKKDVPAEKPEASPCTCCIYCTVPGSNRSPYTMDAPNKRCVLTPMVLNGSTDPPFTNRHSLYCICRDQQFSELRSQHCIPLRGTFLASALEKDSCESKRGNSGANARAAAGAAGRSKRSPATVNCFDISAKAALEALEQQNQREATMEKADYFPCLYIHPQSLPLLLYVLEGYNVSDVMQAVQNWTQAIQSAHSLYFESKNMFGTAEASTPAVAPLPLNQSLQADSIDPSKPMGKESKELSTSPPSPNSSFHTEQQRDIWKHAVPRHSLLHSDFVECFLCQGVGTNGNGNGNGIGGSIGNGGRNGNGDDTPGGRSYTGNGNDLCTGCDADLWVEMEENRTRIAMRHRSLQGGGGAHASRMGPKDRRDSGGQMRGQAGSTRTEDEFDELLPLSLSRLPPVVTIDWWMPSNLPSPQTLQAVQCLSQTLTATLLPLPPSDLLQPSPIPSNSNVPPNQALSSSFAATITATTMARPKSLTTSSEKKKHRPALACPYEGTIWWHLARLDLCARYRLSPDPTTCLCGICDMRTDTPTPDTPVPQPVVHNTETQHSKGPAASPSSRKGEKNQVKKLPVRQKVAEPVVERENVVGREGDGKNVAVDKLPARVISGSSASRSQLIQPETGPHLTSGLDTAEVAPTIPAGSSKSRFTKPQLHPVSTAHKSATSESMCACRSTNDCVATVFTMLTRILLRPHLRYRTDGVLITTSLVLKTLNSVPFSVLYTLFAHEYEDICRAYYKPAQDPSISAASTSSGAVPVSGVLGGSEAVPVESDPGGVRTTDTSQGTPTQAKGSAKGLAFGIPPVAFAPLVYFVRLVGVEFVTYWMLQTIKQQECLPILNFFLHAYNEWIASINEQQSLHGYSGEPTSARSPRGPQDSSSHNKKSPQEFWNTKVSPIENDGILPVHRATTLPDYFVHCTLTPVPLLDTTKDHIGVGANWLAFELLSFLRKATFAAFGSTCARAVAQSTSSTANSPYSILSSSVLPSPFRRDGSADSDTESESETTFSSSLRLFSIHPSRATSATTIPTATTAPSTLDPSLGNSTLASSLLLPGSNNSHGLFRLPTYIPNPYSCLDFNLTSPYPYPLYPAAPPPPAASPDALDQFQFDQSPLQTYTTADKKEKKGNKVSLTECLDLYVAPSELSVDNVWKCSYCNDRVQALRQTLLSSAPKILCIALKRIIPLSDYGDMDKTDVTVEFPLQSLDLSPWMELGSVDRASLVQEAKGAKGSKGAECRGETGRDAGSLQQRGSTGSAPHPPVYDLFAACDHIGSLQTGHYTSVIRGKSGTWYFINDQLVEPVLSEDALEEILESIGVETKERPMSPGRSQGMSGNTALAESGRQVEGQEQSEDRDRTAMQQEAAHKEFPEKYNAEVLKALERKIVSPATCALFYIRRDSQSLLPNAEPT